MTGLEILSNGQYWPYPGAGKQWMSPRTRALVCSRSRGIGPGGMETEMATKKKTTRRAAKRNTKKKGAAKGKARARRTAEPAAGTVLKREFKGQKVTVKVTESGYRYSGTEYPSLTAVAKAITGYPSVSGPRFFGTDVQGGEA